MNKRRRYKAKAKRAHQQKWQRFMSTIRRTIMTTTMELQRDGTYVPRFHWSDQPSMGTLIGVSADCIIVDDPLVSAGETPQVEFITP